MCFDLAIIIIEIGKELEAEFFCIDSINLTVVFVCPIIKGLKICLFILDLQSKYDIFSDG